MRGYRNSPHPLATLQWGVGVIVLALAAWFLVLDRTESPTGFIGPRFFVVLLTPFGLGLIGSGLALRFRCSGWQFCSRLHGWPLR